MRSGGCGRPAELYPHGTGRAERQYAGEKRVSAGYYFVPAGADRRRADDFGQPEQHDRPADAVLRHDALRRHEQTAGRPLRAAGGAKLVQNSRADRRVARYVPRMGAECSAAVSGWRRIFRNHGVRGERSRHCQRCGARRADGMDRSAIPSKARSKGFADCGGVRQCGGRKAQTAQGKSALFEGRVLAVFPMRFQQRKTCS